MAIPEPIPKRSDERKIARNAALLQIGHEGVMLQRVIDVMQHVKTLARKTLNGTIGQADASDGTPPSEGEDVGVNIGNETHFHLESPNKSNPPPAIAGAASNGIMKYLAAFVSGGALVVAGNLLSAINSTPTTQPLPVPPPPFVDTDTDNTVRLHLPP